MEGVFVSFIGRFCFVNNVDSPVFNWKNLLKREGHEGNEGKVRKFKALFSLVSLCALCV
jgi:hypothetical protein